MNHTTGLENGENTSSDHISATRPGAGSCRQGKWARFATAVGLISKLIEAQAQLRRSKLETAPLKLDLLIKVIARLQM